MVKHLLKVLLLSIMIGTATAALDTNIVNYTLSNAKLLNPERGFFSYTENLSSNPTQYEPEYFKQLRLNDNISLLFCAVYLDTFIDSPISEEFLQLLRSNFNAVRDSGLKCILRFGYTKKTSPPYGDATKERILAHIDQLKPILRANQDVIALMESGFIGTWGEGFFTDHFVDDPMQPWNISAAQWLNRADVNQAILAALPKVRMISVRTPAAKQLMFGFTTPISDAEAFGKTVRARIGYYNNCFLSNENDRGFFRDNNDAIFLGDETAYLPMGGRACEYIPTSPRYSCASVQEEMAKYHWSYTDLSPQSADVINRWKAEKCFNVIGKKMGYRFQLLRGIFDNTVVPGAEFSVELTLINTGWATPYNPRKVELLLREMTTNSIYRATLPAEPQRWYGSQLNTLTYAVCTPASLPAGRYELLLNLPDPQKSLHDRPEYSILLANQDVPEPATGFNKLLHTITVLPGSSPSACNSQVTLTP